MDLSQGSVRWAALWRRCGLEPPAGADAQSMAARWSEPGRVYHTLQHLGECLDWLDQMRGFAAAPDEVELALWYHDAVYDPVRSDNEAASGRLAAEHLGAAGAPRAMIAAVQALILDTAHQRAPTSADGAIVVDIDLAILGAPDDRFREYERQIREEYAFVPEFLFRRKRKAILQQFLGRSRLYATALMTEQLEERARANLGAALARLEAG